MKSILTVLILAFGFLTASAQDFSKAKILPANGKRKSEVLANTAVIRFKTYPESSLLKTASAKIIAPFLKPEQSLTFNKNLLKKGGNSVLSAQKILQIQRAEVPLLKTVVVTFEGIESPEEFCQRVMRENPNVEIAEPYRVHRPLGMPNDPLTNQQEYLNTIKAYEAWDIYEGDTSMVIAVSDNAILQTHEDLKNSIARNFGEIPNNNQDDDNNGYVDDYEGYTFDPDAFSKGNTAPGSGNGSHGTNVAGLAGATWSNGIGIAGVGGKCRIFPLKAGTDDDDDGILYGYQAIMYAAQNNFKVINCSWGSPGDYSFIEQSIIDYAVSRNLAIIAAGGNKGNSIPYYPAAYRGVLGVGETRQNDEMHFESNYGAHIDIMAPGERPFKTNSFNDYDNSGSGTSYSSPMVAGMVALIRAKYPQLSAIQALEFARRSADNISDKNPVQSQIIPGRMNMLKAMTEDPFALASIRPLEFKTLKTNAVEAKRFSSGDTVLLKIKARNELGAGSNVKFTLTVLEDFASSVKVVQPELTIAQIAPSSEILLDQFSLRITNRNSQPVFLRVDMEDANGYKDYFLLPFVPTSEVTTFKNAIASYSVSDRGRLGFSASDDTHKEGVGFVYSDFANMLWKGGLIVAQSPEKVVSAVEDNDLLNEFTVVKPFAAPNENTGIINDANAGDKKIGMEITQHFTLLKDSNGVAYGKIFLKNTSGAVLNNISAGYFFDWDVSSNPDLDMGRLFNEAIPQNSLKAAAACIVETSVGYPVAGCAVSTSASGAEAQIAIYNVNEEPGNSFEDPIQYESISSGKTNIFTGQSDIAVVVGMKFAGAWQPGETKDFTMLFGAAASTQELKTRFLTMLDSAFTSVNSPVTRGEFLKISPQPAQNNFSIEGSFKGEVAEISIIAPDGRIAIEKQMIALSDGFLKTSFSTLNLASGLYFVKIQSGGNFIVKPIVIAK